MQDIKEIIDKLASSVPQDTKRNADAKRKFNSETDELVEAFIKMGKCTNITDALVPYFEGKVSWEKGVSEACELFQKTFESATFICESCGEIIFPKVIMNEHGIFIESKRTDIRGSKGNQCIKKNICKDCVRKMSMKG